MAARRTTNNSVASLEEQSAVIESVISKEKERSLTKKEKDKKKRAKTLDKKPRPSSSAAQAVPVEPIQGEAESDSVPADSEPEEVLPMTWIEAQAQLRAFNLVNPYGANLGISQEQWDNPSLEDMESRQSVHDISYDSSELLSQVEPEQGDALPAVPIQAEPIQLTGSGALADFLREQLSHVKECDKVSPKLDDTTALIVNKILKESVYMTEMEKLAKSHPRVENVDYMKVPRLDMEVYEVIDQKVRNFDQNLQNIQKGVLSAVSALSPVLSLIIARGETDEDLNKVGRNLGESIKLLAYVNNILSSKRREVIKPYLAPVYAKVLTKGHDTTPDWLYGGDLVTTTRKCEASQKLAQKILKRKPDQEVRKPQPANKRFKGPKNAGAAMLRAFNPLMPQNIRFPSPQMINEYLQAQMGLQAFDPRQFMYGGRNRFPQQQFSQQQGQGNFQGYPKKPNFNQK